MEQNNVENQIREKLNAREIQPSPQAWDRLDAMLTIAEEKKTKRSLFLSFPFIGIAASVLVFVTLGLLLFNQSATKIETPNAVVGTEIKKDNVEIPNSKFQIPSTKNKQENEEVATSDVQPTTNNRQPTTNHQGVSIKNQEIIIQKTNSNQNQIIKDKKIEYVITEDVALKDLPKIETRKEIIVQGYNNAKSDEALLASLDKVAKQSTNQKSGVKVDAKSLLSQVDGEVEQTFREKVITKINKNYKEVKVALANRNNQ
ncbi:MAG: hypothetical protein IM568_09375 [Flavobacterium sp.]|nr:hypothetical protein [Flavobacterium sp.]